MRSIGKKFLSGLCLAALLVNITSAINNEININRTGIKSPQTLGAGIRGAVNSNNKILDWIKNHKGATAAIAVGILSAGGLGLFLGLRSGDKDDNEQFTNNLSEEERIIKFFETVPSVYDCDKQSINNILGNDINDGVGKSQRYFEKVKEVAKKIDLGSTIPSEYEKQLCGYSIQMLIVLMSDALRTVKLIENKNFDVFGFANLYKCKNEKEQSGDAYWICNYKIGGIPTFNFNFRITKEGKIDDCVIFKSDKLVTKKMVKFIFNNCNDWKDIKTRFSNDIKDYN